jgi:hypothetical protein
MFRKFMVVNDVFPQVTGAKGAEEKPCKVGSCEIETAVLALKRGNFVRCNPRWLLGSALLFPS